MICPRHGAIAETGDDHGRPLCSACFTEALRHADMKLLEQRVAAMRLTSASALLRRLGGTR